jgi:very-short-patch-repair endonuclease
MGKARAARRAWLAERGYRVMEATAADIGADVAAIIDRLAANLETAAEHRDTANQ